MWHICPLLEEPWFWFEGIIGMAMTKPSQFDGPLDHRQEYDPILGYRTISSNRGLI